MIIETIKEAIKKKSMVKYHKQTIDMQTANAMLKVYTKLNAKNKLFITSETDFLIPQHEIINLAWAIRSLDLETLPKGNVRKILNDFFINLDLPVIRDRHHLLESPFKTYTPLAKYL